MTPETSARPALETGSESGMITAPGSPTLRNGRSPAPKLASHAVHRLLRPADDRGRLLQHFPLPAALRGVPGDLHFTQPGAAGGAGLLRPGLHHDAGLPDLGRIGRPLRPKGHGRAGRLWRRRTAADDGLRAF